MLMRGTLHLMRNQDAFRKDTFWRERDVDAMASFGRWAPFFAIV